jgi:hypothetical protein
MRIQGTKIMRIHADADADADPQHWLKLKPKQENICKFSLVDTKLFFPIRTLESGMISKGIVDDQLPLLVLQEAFIHTNRLQF